MEHIEYISHRAELAARIRELRVARGYSTRGFCMMVGMSKTYLRRIEIAEASPTFDMLERIAAGLDIHVSKLVDFECESDEFSNA